MESNDDTPNGSITYFALVKERSWFRACGHVFITAVYGAVVIPSSVRVRRCVGQGKSDDGVPNRHGIRSGGDHQADDGTKGEFNESAHS